MPSTTANDFIALVEFDPALFDVQTSAAGPAGSLPLIKELPGTARLPAGPLLRFGQEDKCHA
ncbi:MAG: hypothetical protein ACRELF_00305 [Gemmataceae bacterium]